jgi:hypothetical protein
MTLGQRTISKLHGEARLQVTLAKMDGYKIDKKVCRFNEIVSVAFRYGQCGGDESSVVVAGLREAIDCCVVGDPMHTGESCTSLVSDWMIQNSEGQVT